MRWPSRSLPRCRPPRSWAIASSPTIVIAVEHYGRLVRTLQKQVPVQVELTVKNTITEDQEGLNILAELPGTDKADEIVMLGAHFDSWHGGTGATDNAAGSAVMLEALRILKASGVRLRRTVRLALWGGEEQGLNGSRAYVTDHPEVLANLQLLLNHDSGTGRVTNVSMGTEIDNVTEFEEPAESGDDAPTALYANLD